MSGAPTLTTAEASYGSDAAGIVCAYAFVSGAPSCAVDADEALRCLRNGLQDGRFLWLHFALSNAASERWMKQNLTLLPTFYESLKENPSTRVEAVENALVAVVRDVQFFGAETGNHATVTLSVDQHLMVRARTTQL